MDKPDQKLSVPRVSFVRITYDPAGRDGDGVDEITFADLEYDPVNDNGGMPRKKARLLAFALITLIIAGFYWLWG